MTNIDYHWHKFDQLSLHEFYQIVMAREAVFVVEQNCPYQETDEMDAHSWHLQLKVDGELAAYARVVEPGIKYSQPSIGRVLTIKKFRGQKLGEALMREAIKFTEETYPGEGIKIGAQVYLQRFYSALGFQATGDTYDEDGIMHIDMIKP